MLRRLAATAFRRIAPRAHDACSGGHVVAMHERERIEVGRDLHDSPLQRLHAVRMRLDGRIDPSVAADLTAAIDEIKAISDRLYPYTLTTFGLSVGMETLIRRVRELRPDIEIVADICSSSVLGHPAELPLYRVCQSALEEAIQSPEVCRLTVTLQSTKAENRLRMECTSRLQQAARLWEAESPLHVWVCSLGGRIDVVPGRYLNLRLPY